MKNYRTSLILSFFLAVFAFSFNSGFAPAPPDSGTDDAVVKVDGKIIRPEGTITMEKDDTIMLEASGLKPNSSVHFKVKKLGIRFTQDSYRVDENGEIKAIMDIPDMKIKVKVLVNYLTASGKNIDRKVKFAIR